MAKFFRIFAFVIVKFRIFEAQIKRMIQVHNLGLNDSVFNQFIAEIRDAEIQQDRLRFRYNMERLGEIMAYEISKTFEYEEREVTTQLGVAQVRVLKQQPVIATILRAGLPFHAGLLRMFDRADNAFVATYRKYDRNESPEINVEYCSASDMNGRPLILCDPMLATGESLVQTLEYMLDDEQVPSHIHIVVGIASQEGVEHVRRALSRKPVTIWVGAIDDELTAHAYIVPGMGDAGDLAFGEKR